MPFRLNASAPGADAPGMRVLERVRSADACELPATRRADGERRGARWMVVSFVFCPCHLPVTLLVVGALAGGTAIGAFLQGNVLVVGVLTTALWLAGTARGFLLVRSSQRAVRTARALDPGVSPPSA